MSKKGDQAILAWKSLEADLRSLPLCRDRLALSTSDVHNCAQAYTLWCLLLTDLDLLDDRAARRLARRLARFDVLSVVKSLKECDAALLAAWTSGTAELSLERFKHALSEVTPLEHLFLPIVSDYSRSASVGMFRTLHQAFSFLSHLSLDGIPDEQDILGWVENNERLSCADVNLDIAAKMAPVVKEWLAGITIPYCGKHGSGTVWEWPSALMGRRITLADKISDPSGLLYCGYSTRMLEAMEIAGIPEPWRYIPPDFWPNQHHEQTCATTRLITVPKNALKRRVIAPETLSQQFFQQQLMVGLYDHIDRCLPWIPIRDQGQNRRLACEGSISGYYATVDLSAASDSVRTDLVQALFSQTTILDMMEACRSRRAIVPMDGTEYTVPMSMYATMGSAICFPLECIVFSALCEYVAREVGCRLKYSVYGDDIVFPAKHVDRLVDVLAQCGFIVNNDKSFTSQDPLLFRESCGGEYLKGYDVTPLRISRRLRPLMNKRKQPSAYSALIELANACLDRGYLNMRRYVISAYLLAQEPYPIFGDGPNHVHTIGVATNYRLKHRYNRQLQRHECRAAVVDNKEDVFDVTPYQQTKIDLGIDGYLRMLAWERDRLLSERHGVVAEDTVRRTAPGHARTSVRWVCTLY